jgi:hypothetical protein
MSKIVSQEWRTTLTVAELAKWFKATARERYDSVGRAAKLVARGSGVELFTPRAGDSFGAFETQPDSSIGARMPRGGRFGGSAESMTLYMYVTESGGARIARFALPVASMMDQLLAGARRERPVGHSANGARVLLDHFARMLLASDPQAHRES